MSVDISKPADQVLADAKKDLAKAFPTEADQLAAGDKFRAALSDDEEVKKKAYEEIKQLAETVRSLRKDFIDAAGALMGFDTAEFKDKNGNVIQLGPKWRPYIKQYDETLQFSLEQATDATTMLRSINAVLGDITPEDAADLKEELRNFFNMLKRKDADSSHIKDQFQHLADDVSVFDKQVDAALEQPMTPIKAELDRAKSALKGLQKDLKDIDEKINSLSTVTVQMVAVAASAMTGTIAVLNLATVPIATSFLSSCGTGVALKKAMDERKKIIDNIKAKEREIINLCERNELVKKYKTVFLEINAHFIDLFSQLAVILNIWKTVGSDILALLGSIDGGTHDSKLTKPMFRKIQVTNNLYKHLMLLLETYVEQTRSATH